MSATPMTDRLPVAVYGTLREHQGNWSWCLAGRTHPKVDATLTGAAMFDQGGFPFMSLSHPLATPDAAVVMEVFTPFDEIYDKVLADLDRLEGYHGPDFHNLYNRIRVTVTTDVGEQIEAWTYVVADHRSLDAYPHIPSGDWVAYDSHRPAYRGLTWR